MSGQLAEARGNAPVGESAVAPRVDPLPETASLLLDVVRFGLCLLVLLGHATQAYFQRGWPSLMPLANGAVPGFFVLSGFVIRFVTATREREARRYWVSRASRIYSVVVPAIALTVVLDAVSRTANLEFYRTVVQPQPWKIVPFRMVVTLLFLTQGWGHAGLLLSNTPFWSLGYEVPYYVLFGVAAFTHGGVRVALLVVTGLLFGPQVLFLLPIWWSGIWLYDGWQWLRQPGRAGWRVGAAVIALVVLGWLVLPLRDFNGLAHIGNVPNPLLLLHQQPLRATMAEYAAGVLSVCVLFLLLCASDLVRLPKKTLAARAVRQVAEGTFTLYLFHFPMLVCAAALGLYRKESGVQKMALLLGIVVVCVAAAVPIAGFKNWLRDGLSARRG